MKVGEVVIIQLGPPENRKKASATITKVNRRSIWVRLKDGHVINRKMSRDVLTKHREDDGNDQG